MSNKITILSSDCPELNTKTEAIKKVGWFQANVDIDVDVRREFVQHGHKVKGSK